MSSRRGRLQSGRLVWLAGLCALTACDGSIIDPPAQVPAQPLHRLNRLEYNNTVRDLLGTALRPADAFPPDGETDGFDNMAGTLQLTPALLDGYYAAARLVVDDALDERPAFALLRQHDELGVAGGYEVGDLWALSGNVVSIDFEVEAGGATITLLAGASQIGQAPAPQLRLELDGVEVETFTVEGTAAAIVPRVHTLELAAGVHTLRYVPTNFINDAVANTSNNVLVRSVAVESAAKRVGPGRDLVFVCDPIGDEAEACYREIIETFAGRAWRRPLTDDEATRVTALFDDLRARGEDDEPALRLVMRSILTSPKFIYRARTFSDADRGAWLDDFVLASRLSYFLWSSMPDQRLLEAAADGRLASREGLAEAVDWMIDDERAQGLLDGFAEQWLSTRQLAGASPSPEVYPGFDDGVRQAMVAESKQFFADFLYNGLPVTAMLEPDFAYLNDRLAAHYGLAPVGSAEVVRVALDDAARSGILALGAWLTVQSDPDRSSPIRRGRWVSDRILCKPVPPPPSNLPIEPIEVVEGGSIREQLEQHRSEPACAGCHSYLDVLGMGFENFDGVGRLRSEPGLDMLGELPDGRTFEGAGELATLLDEEAFAGCVTSKLYSYSLGRSVVDKDQRYIDDIARRAVADELTLRDIILAIVETPAFRSPGRMQGGE